MSVWGAIGQAVSSAFQTAAGLYESSKSNRAAAANLRSQLDWELQRATNAHQWEVADLRAAGLNPILSATGGSGASTSPITPQLPDFSGISKAGSALGSAISHAYQILSAEKQLKQQDANIALTLKNAEKSEAETKNTAANTLLLARQYEKIAEEIKLLKENINKAGFENFIDFSEPHKYRLHRYFGTTMLGNLLTGIPGDIYDSRSYYDPVTRTLVPINSAQPLIDEPIRIHRLPRNFKHRRK